MATLLRFGSRGDAVREMQEALNLGPSGLPKLVADGIFGQKTHGRVREFQGLSGLKADGIVGPNTLAALGPLLEQLHNLVQPLVAPPDEAAARTRIVNGANTQLQLFGWQDGIPPGLTNPRIATGKWANPATHTRQGGTQLAAIFTAAGHPAAGKCLTLSDKAKAMYDRKHTTAERNQLDLPHWCGIFALSVHRGAGLKLSAWPLRIQGATAHPAEFKAVPPAQVQPGDIGIVEPFGGRNHHFVVVQVQGKTIKTVDGNGGAAWSIVPGEYTTGGLVDPKYGAYQISRKGGVEKGVFVTPLWDRVL